MKSKYVVITLFSITYFAASQTVDEYKSIWRKNMRKIELYKRQVKNEEFEGFSSTHCEETESYDFVIVGGGTAGTVLTNRLSEYKNWRILLLEAGGDETDFSQIPSVFTALALTDMNWGYITEPQKHACLSARNAQCDFLRAKVLGGGSAVNAMMHVRGNKRDFDRWAEAGNEGWSYQDCLPYFIKSETVSFPADPGFHGYNGPLNISRETPEVHFLDYIIKGMADLGFKEVDYNGKQQIGISRIQANTKNGKRWSTNQAYLQPAKRRKNVKIITKALVTKINFKGNDTAESVTYLKGGKCFVVKATEEIIVSAGSINTPQLLMLSGIGPAAHLKDRDITPIANLPVGQNLFDHLAVFTINFSTNMSTTVPSLDESFKDLVEGKGYLTYIGAQGLQVMQTKPDETQYPDMEIFYSALNPHLEPDIALRSDNYAGKMIKYLNNFRTSDIVVSFMLYHPKSQGTVTLKSNDPIDFPLVDPNYLSNPFDIEVIYKSIQEFLKVLKTDAAKQINMKLADNPVPGCNHLKGKKYWICVIEHVSRGIYHPTSTCRMGRNTSDSVVNSNLLVHGFKNLRIVDASVVPFTTSGHMNSVVVMIAEKISDVIKSVVYECNLIH